MPKPLQMVWAAVVLFGLGSGFGTLLHRLTRLPSWFWLPCVSMAACGTAYVLFFVSFFDSDAGRIAAVACWIASVVVFAAMLRDREVRQTLRQRDAWLPALLTAILATSYLASLIGSGTYAHHRFRFALPPDYDLPRMFAERVANGGYGFGITPPPLDGDWRGSDRPPLQAAITLATMALGRGDPAWFYQFIATLCQMGWLATLYALARTIALPRRYVQFTLAAAATSPFFFFNSVYPWPKLLAAWLCVLGLAIVLEVVREHERRQAPGWDPRPDARPADSRMDARSRPPGPPLAATCAIAVAAGAIALGVLAHGGVTFSLIALPLLGARWTPWRAVPPDARVRAALATIAVVLVAMGPWMAYQRFYDPPGNRLLKMHLAGVEAVDPRPTSTAIADTYRELTWSSYLAGRWANVAQQWFGTYPIPLESPIDWVQFQQLMRHVPLIGFLCAGYVLLIWTPARRDLPDASLRVVRQLTWYALATAAIWIVVMIVPASTMVHQGSYVMTMLLLFAAAVLTAMLPPIVRWTLVSLHVLLFATCYLLSVRTSNPPPHTWRLETFVESALALLVFLVLLRAVPDAPAAVGSAVRT